MLLKSLQSNVKDQKERSSREPGTTTKIPKGVRNYCYSPLLGLLVVPIHKVAFYALTEILLCAVFLSI